jgi:hypothetical protein
MPGLWLAGGRWARYRSCSAQSGSQTGSVTAASRSAARNADSSSPQQTASQALSITVAQGAQAISFTAPATGTAGHSAALTATGGGSGNPVVFTVDASSGAGVCTVSGADGSTVNYAAAGSCVIDANQAGNANYTAVPQVQQIITVYQAPAFVLDTPPLTATVGQPYDYTFEASGPP